MRNLTNLEIAHAGQFMAEGQIYVSQEVPEYVVMDGNGRLVPIDINDCKVMLDELIFQHTSIYVCMSRAVSSCDVTTMTGCEIVAQRTTDGFMAIKSFDTDNIVATNLPVRQIS
uniref:Phage related protein n=1 Tax=Angiostrongylus cantonensis TaxID=6313 RepID=A0A0K0DMK7_ANGCA